MSATYIWSIEGVKELHPLDLRITVDVVQGNHCIDFIQSRVEETELSKQFFDFRIVQDAILVCVVAVEQEVDSFTLGIFFEGSKIIIS